MDPKIRYILGLLPPWPSPSSRYELEDDEDEEEGSEDEPRLEFADPGGRSALRAASPSNPRIFPCPTCQTPDVLTQKDVDQSYQCDRCADRDEGHGF